MYKIGKTFMTILIASTLFLVGGNSVEIADASTDSTTTNQGTVQENRVAVGEEISLTIDTINTSEVSWSVSDLSIAKIINTGTSSITIGNSSRESHGVTLEGLRPGNIQLSVYDDQGRLLGSSKVLVILSSEKNDEDIQIQEARAIEAVEMAENFRLESEKRRAQKLVSYLPLGTVRSELENRLEAIVTWEESSALLDVEFAENSKTNEAKNTAQAAINDLPSSSVKKELQARLDVIVTHEDLELEAIQAVETAEAKKNNVIRSHAQSKVEKLRQGEVRRNLEARLKAIATEEDSNLVGWIKEDAGWYYYNNNGVMQTGWTKVGNTWYYMAGSGAMQTGWTKVGNTWYYMAGSGAMQTGWTKVGNTWYYMAGSGAMKTGWLKIGQNWYYLNSNGSMQTKNASINGKWYQFASSGRML